jgi:hypothetical protein
MKLNVRTALAAVLGGMLIYSACTKSGSHPAATSTTLTTNQSGQIAIRLYSILTGEYGGQSINNGIKAPTSLAPNHRAPVLQSVNTLCGYSIDTTYNTSFLSNDTTFTTGGTFKFTYTCNANTVNGYILYDSVATDQSAAQFYQNRFIAAQNYTATELSSSSFAVTGGIRSSSDYITGPGASQYTASNYVLSGVTIVNNAQIADITTGTAVFTIETKDNGTMTAYAGTIYFLGNHIAKLVITGGGTYSINFLSRTAAAE